MNRPDGKEAERAKATLLTIGALYFVPISIGLRVEGFGPTYLLMLGLAAVAISKVVHLREAVTDTDKYPTQLVLVDLVIILSLLVMFQLLARPFSFSSGLWHATTPSDLIPSDTSDAAFVRGAKVFWSLAICLFVLLIPTWTWVSWRYQGLRRHRLGQYIAGWVIGAVLSGYMLHTAANGTIQQLLQQYKAAGPVSLISLPFLALEVFSGSKFERRVAVEQVKGPEVSPGTILGSQPKMDSVPNRLPT